MRFLNILTINKLQNEFESRPSRHFEEEPSRKLDGFFSYQTRTAVWFFKPQFFITSRHFEEEPSRKLDGFFLTKLEQRLDSSNRNSLSHPATLKKNRPESWTVFLTRLEQRFGSSNRNSLLYNSYLQESIYYI